MPLYNPPITIQNNSANQGTVDVLNLTGSISAIVVGNIATLDATGSSGSSISMTQVEVDFGSQPTRNKTFVISDGYVTSSSHLIITQSGTAATGRQSDEAEMDPIIFSGVPEMGQFTVYANSLNGPVVGKYKLNYLIG